MAGMSVFAGKRRMAAVAATFCVSMSAAVPVAAMSSLSEDEMSTVSGQDGILVSIGTNTQTATRLRLDVDNPNASYPGYNSYLDLEGVTLTGVNATGTSTGLATSLTAQFDAGADSQTSLPTLSLDADWTRTRFRVDAIRHQSQPTRSYGATVFDASGSLDILGPGGLFNSAGTNAYVRLQLNDAEWYYRQNSNEFIWDNLNADVGYTGGTLGITSSGVVMTTSRFNWNVLWDIGFRSNPGVAFSSATGVVPFLRYGWSGGLTTIQATISGGGVWVGAPTSRTEGLNISWRADADTDFQWIIGDAGGAPAMLYFTDWVNMPGASAGLIIPNLTLDVVNAGQGAGSFLYKGVNTSAALEPDAGGLAVVMRDTSFLTYNTKVRVVDTTIARDQVYDWGLVYTLGDVDLNLYAYPGGKAAVNPNEGLRFDLALGVQSPSTWNRNTHFIIADTDVASNVGVGFLNTNFLITINDGYLTLLPTGAELETTTDFRWQLDGQFGGGPMSDLSSPIRMFDLGLDLHASQINVLFTPPVCSPVCGKYMGFQWDARLYQSNASDPSTADSFISIAEPSRSTVKLVLGQIGGDIQARNGVIDLEAGTDTPDLDTRLTFEQDLRFGMSATNAGFFGTNRPLIINNVAIGSAKIGSLAIPGGNWYGALSLKQQ